MITMTISIEEVANLEVRPVPKPFTNLKLYKSRKKGNGENVGQGETQINFLHKKGVVLRAILINNRKSKAALLKAQMLK